jgi:2-iminobutanoate/2-iminopropanoate deaminase
VSAARRSISIEGLSHQTGIPCGSRIGPLLTTSVIMPFEPGTRDVPDTVEAQVANVFMHAEAILVAAGGGWKDVAKMNFWVTEGSHRDLIEQRWLDVFPDPASRPARHTQVQAGPGKAGVFADLLAYIVD